MKLTKVRIREYKSIRDSGECEIGNITCLVGKNEAGKTALLEALYRLNPIIPAAGTFDVTEDYPRADVEDYRLAVEAKQREEAVVVEATFSLDGAEADAIRGEIGDGLNGTNLTVRKGYQNKVDVLLPVDTDRAVQHLVKTAGLAQDVVDRLAATSRPEDAIKVLGDASVEKTQAVQKLTQTLTVIRDRGLSTYISDKHITARLPKFFYFDEYYEMTGEENIEALIQRQANPTTLKRSDHPMLGLIELARLKLPELLNTQRTQDLVNKLEGAGNYLSKQVLKYWSQNKHLKMSFDVRPARPGDPAGMQSGTNIWGQVYDSRHQVHTGLGTRSRGFVWFFSFLAWYSQLKRKNEPMILLLDEPALSLHAKAQKDLLQYFEKELGPAHQVIYTTHSPFMVDPLHWERTRIVQDRGIDATEEVPPDQDGTRVLADVLEASSDSLFPLQGALGYEIHQTLFIGPNCLIVEGVSDLLYLQTMSGLLERAGREGLSQKWTITPVGGADKVPTFVALIGAQKALSLATLIDIDKKHEQVIENLYKKKLLEKNRVLTYGDFVGTRYADAEDMFEVAMYLDLVNGEYKGELSAPIAEADLTSKNPRVIVRLDEYFTTHPMSGAAFNHYRPARYFAENVGALRGAMSPVTLERFEAAFKALNRLLPQ